MGSKGTPDKEDPGTIAGKPTSPIAGKGLRSMFIIGHRGARGVEPENTLRAFRASNPVGRPLAVSLTVSVYMSPACPMLIVIRQVSGRS